MSDMIESDVPSGNVEEVEQIALGLLCVLATPAVAVLIIPNTESGYLSRRVGYLKPVAMTVPAAFYAKCHLLFLR
jgi:hypothetical protein